MKRYLITNKLRNGIKNSNYSIRELNKLLGFEIRNILNKNISIKEDHLQKLNYLLNLDIRLKETYLDYGKNLGKNAFTQPINKVNKSEGLAEFIGIILGDGNIWNNRVRIAFDKRNEEYILYVGEFFKNIFGINPKKEILKNKNGAYLYINNKYAVEKLLLLGLKRGDKITNQAGIPKWIKQNRDFSRACIRGLIDTDGCVYFCKRERKVYIKFTNFNQQLLNDFKEVTQSLKYSFAKANKQNVCLYRKEDVARFINDIKPLKSKGMSANLVKLQGLGQFD